MATIKVDRNVIATSSREPETRIVVEPSAAGVVFLLQHEGVRMTVVLDPLEAQHTAIGLIAASVDSERARHAQVQAADTLPALPTGKG